MDRMDELNRRMADKGEPVFALAAVLERRGKEARDRLKQLTGASNLYAWLTDAKNLSMVLMALPSADYALFTKAAEAPFIKEKDVFLPLHSGLIGFCLLLQPYQVEEELYLVVPTEIRNLWRELKNTDLPRRKQLHDVLDAYAQAAVKLYGVLSLADFGIVEELAGEMTDVKFAKVNVDEEPALANAFRVNAIPTLVLMKDGKAVGQSVGLRGKPELKAMIEAAKKA